MVLDDQVAPYRIVVTGAGGFVGRHLLAALRAAFPASILIAATRSQDQSEPMLRLVDETVSLDLVDLGNIGELLSATAPDALVHLAAKASVAESFQNPEENWRVNLLGTVSVAEAVLRHAPKCRFVLASSAEIYGLSFRESHPLTELAPMLPANPYAASKAAIDLAIGEMALRGLDAIRLRAFNHTGAGQLDSFVVSAFARQIAEIEAGQRPPILRVGALDRWRDFLDVEDVCRAYVAALQCPDTTGAAFNIASGVPRRIGDILEALLDRTTSRPTIEVETTRLRPTDVERVVGDATKARDILGWSPIVSWNQTLDSVLGDWRGRV
jgi:GDP-4-dehydro-6-deoxy-D-mannose reductase